MYTRSHPWGNEESADIAGVISDAVPWTDSDNPVRQLERENEVLWDLVRKIAQVLPRDQQDALAASLGWRPAD